MKFCTEKRDIESQFLFFLFLPFEFVDADNFDAGFDVIFSRLIFSIAKNIFLETKVKFVILFYILVMETGQCTFVEHSSVD